MIHLPLKFLGSVLMVLLETLVNISALRGSGVYTWELFDLV